MNRAFRGVTSVGLNKKAFTSDNQFEISTCDLTQLEGLIFDKNGLLKILPYSFYEQICSQGDWNYIHYFMYVHGLYTLPTAELIDFIKSEIVGSAIEICCGNGAIGRNLGIPITDSKVQETEKPMYQELPTIKYPTDVQKIDAHAAIDSYKPDTVVGSFVTHKYVNPKVGGFAYGVVEGKIVNAVQKYIHIGNNVTHAKKPILKHKHRSLYFDWLITRAKYQKENRILIFEK